MSFFQVFDFKSKLDRVLQPWQRSWALEVATSRRKNVNECGS